MADSESYTRDSISLRGAGVVTVVQPKTGARFNLDSVLLADFCRVKPRDRILEPGTGTGIVSLLLARRHPRSHIVAVEVQGAAAGVCSRNIVENGLEKKITLIEQDLRTLKNRLKASSFDVIVANPPYTKTGAGRQSPSPGRLSARHERFGDIGAWLDLGRYLKNKGRYALVFSADRVADLIIQLRSRSLEPKRMRLVYPYRDKPASLVLLEAVRSAGPGLQVLSPLIVHVTGGGYSEEMQAIYGRP